jgi:lipid-binding SYLF domain-containing protein
MTEGSVGLLAGAQSQAVFILFMTDDALDRFRSSSGWTVGADASVALLTVGADARVTSQTAQQPVIGFVLANRGLMGNLSLSSPFRKFAHVFFRPPASGAGFAPTDCAFWRSGH